MLLFSIRKLYPQWANLLFSLCTCACRTGSLASQRIAPKSVPSMHDQYDTIVVVIWELGTPEVSRIAIISIPLPKYLILC